MTQRRLLVLAPAPVVQASTRYRLELYRAGLQAAGIEMVLRPFLDDAGIGMLYRSGDVVGKLQVAANAVWKRLSDLVSAHSFDAVLIHREAALIGPPLFEWLLAYQLSPLSRPLIFDLDDAIWVPYASPTYGATLSRLLKAPGKTNFTLGIAQQVIAGNQYVADHARRFNPAVTVIPTVVDTDVFCPRPARRPLSDVPILGWIGTHSTGPYLQSIVPALRRLYRKRPFILRVIGGKIDAPDLPVEHRDWSLSLEVADFQELDIGLFPVVPDAWSLGKSGFKAIQYMACGVPVVASPVGTNAYLVKHGETGFLAQTDDQWVDCLNVLLGDPSLRQRMGMAAREVARAKFCRRVHEPRFVSVIEQAMSKPARQ